MMDGWMDGGEMEDEGETDGWMVERWMMDGWMDEGEMKDGGEMDLSVGHKHID